MNDDDKKFIDKIVGFRILYEKDKTNDYYFIQYIASILDYIERSSNGFLTDLGRLSLSTNIGHIHKRMTECIDKDGKKISQRDLIRFCLYMTDAYACCVMYKGMIEVYKESDTGFIELHPLLPTYILGDFIEYEDKATELVSHFKSIMDTYSKMLEGKYKTIFNDEKHKGFVKQIFNTFEVNTQFRPKEIENARECK
jgi:hypothetical protein